jgi:UV DNA damage repair endonuclease
MQDAFDAACATWPGGIRPLQHISNTDPSRSTGSFLERRKHSDFIHYVPQCQLVGLRAGLIDLEVEAKQKNMAVFKMAKDFGLELT